MKRIALTALAVVLVNLHSYSQEAAAGSNEVQLSDIKAPSSPAFTILGMQPSEIARPNSYNSLVAGLYSSFTDNNNFILPKNYALEFTPYWMSSHPKLTYSQYVDPTVDQSILQNSSVSLATNEVTNATDTSKKLTRMGLGYRTLVWSGTANTKSAEYIRLIQELHNYRTISSSLRAAIATVSSAAKFDDFVKEVIGNIKDQEDAEGWTKEGAALFKSYVDQYVLKFLNEKTTSLTGSDRTVDTLKAQFARRFFGEVDAQLAKDVESVQKIINRRNGFILEVAAALALDFPTNRFDFSKASKYGIWVTPTFRVEDPQIDISCVLRYLKNENLGNAANDFTDNTDFGASVSYDQDKFSVYAEIIFRNQKVTLSKTQVGSDVITTTKSRSDLRYSFNIDYRLSEKVMLTYSFGKNFDQYIEFNNNLLSLVSLSFNFGAPLADSIE